MKKDLKEIGLNFVFGVGLTVAIASVGAVVSYFSDLDSYVSHIVQAFGYLVVFVGTTTIGRRIRNKFFKKGE